MLLGPRPVDAPEPAPVRAVAVRFVVRRLPIMSSVLARTMTRTHDDIARRSGAGQSRKIDMT
ncbi:MAG: hypothetical protein ABI112_07190 [Terracoccus sp.]